MFRAKAGRAGQSLYDAHVVKIESRRELVFSSEMAASKGGKKIVQQSKEGRGCRLIGSSLSKDAHQRWGTWDPGQMFPPGSKMFLVQL